MFWRLEIELKCGQGWRLWEALENLLQASLAVWGRVQLAEASGQMLVLSLYGQFLSEFLPKNLSLGYAYPAQSPLEHRLTPP